MSMRDAIEAIHDTTGGGRVMRFYYTVGVSSKHEFIDDWVEHKYCRLRPFFEKSRMNQMAAESGMTRFYGAEYSAHPIPDLCVILITGKDRI